VYPEWCALYEGMVTDMALVPLYSCMNPLMSL